MTSSTENPYSAWTIPEVRDLAWACFSPALLNSSELGNVPATTNCTLALDETRRAWLSALDNDPSELREWLGDSRHGRLGLYFERLWQFFLHHDPQVELLAHNLPVRENGQTLGEFDVLYHCHRRQCDVHLELAVKFYLQHQSNNGAWNNWLGPNSRDRLDKKIQRMCSHQLKLADTEAGRSALNALGFGDVRREMEVKGRLYHHLDAPLTTPPGATLALQCEPWVRLSELAPWLQQGGDFYRLQGSDWLAPIANVERPAQDTSGLKTEIEESLGQYSRPLQVAVLQEGVEQQRCFVVPDNWPRHRE